MHIPVGHLLHMRHAQPTISDPTITRTFATVLRKGVGQGSKATGFEPKVLDVGNGMYRQVFTAEEDGIAIAGGSFEAPCQPSTSEDQDGFYSGLMMKGETFTIERRHPETPLFFYSATSYDCANGIVGVLNPTAEKNLDSYIAAAAANKAIGQVAPRPFGGRLGPVIHYDGINGSLGSTLPTSLTSIMPFHGKLGVDIIAIIVLMLVGVVVGAVCFWISEWMDARLEAKEAAAAAKMYEMSQPQYSDFDSDYEVESKE